MNFFKDDEIKWLNGLDMAKGNNQGIDVDYETQLLSDTKTMLKIFNREVYDKMVATAEVSAYLGGAMGINEIQFYLAAHYANIGYLGLPNIIGKKDFLTHDEKKISHLHPMYSLEYMRTRNLNIAAYLVYMHHELPNGKGYHREQKLSMDCAYLIHIADSFVGMLSHKSYRPGYSKEAAINTVLHPYEHYDTFIGEIDAIRTALGKVSLDDLGL